MLDIPFCLDTWNVHVHSEQLYRLNYMQIFWSYYLVQVRLFSSVCIWFSLVCSAILGVPPSMWWRLLKSRRRSSSSGCKENRSPESRWAMDSTGQMPLTRPMWTQKNDWWHPWWFGPKQMHGRFLQSTCNHPHEFESNWQLVAHRYFQPWLQPTTAPNAGMGRSDSSLGAWHMRTKQPPKIKIHCIFVLKNPSRYPAAFICQTNHRQLRTPPHTAKSTCLTKKENSLLNQTVFLIKYTQRTPKHHIE